MTEETINKEEYEAKIAELEKQLETKNNEALEAQKTNETLEQQLKEAQNNNNETYEDIKQKYDEIIATKNQEIQELTIENQETRKKVNETVTNLQEEVQARLDANEEYQKLLSTVEELEREKAEATVDAYIKKGVILPVQRETALKLCINDPDTFENLYREAKPIVEIQEQRRSISNGTAQRIANYFKN